MRRAKQQSHSRSRKYQDPAHPDNSCNKVKKGEKTQNMKYNMVFFLYYIYIYIYMAVFCELITFKYFLHKKIILFLIKIDKIL